ncbi:ADP-ribosylation factor-like protein 6-interacting protein 6 [Hippoglossus hippoglossus]|uniref:ADP-ribosylation factor-like protein 6-interacting protein 6 n=1 Tax=Hippoglossus hippoglossus TaxID=8267 RepID=UPI00148D7147|nr:ADP-ribosylation factor-like protein 6-interacting protein 6 [Hippoglossus hippoglossus]XP_034465994.1 ADP-ribosylation factor-like protein 6-interacting protein 6 [Hippoglossus hippoglossus]XP_034466003.1 ADP-ribosylation factor-like protein 6-interacting protein 6 [Hippoglossus hippoglossus]
MEHPGSSSVGPGGRVGSGAADRPLPHRPGPRRWSVVALSVLGSAACVSAVGCLCAFIYPILKELRAGRVRGEDGTEERILGFWSILVLSVVVGCICSVFSWTLTYLDSYQPGTGFLSPLSLAPLRDESGHGFQVGYGAVGLNGIMAMLTVFWILT